jgi:hypothetical protein
MEHKDVEEDGVVENDADDEADETGVCKVAY